MDLIGDIAQIVLVCIFSRFRYCWFDGVTWVTSVKS